MRPVCILCVMAALLPCASSADDYSDCRLTCAAERDTRNMNCPSPYDVSPAGEERRQCLKENQDAYADCVKHCPTPPVQQEEAPSPPNMSY